MTKTQSFKHQKSEGLSTPSFLRKFSFKKSKESTTAPTKILKKQTSPQPERILENPLADFNRNNDYVQANTRDVTSAIVDSRGGILVNEYWGVTLEVPENAIPQGVKQELYFVITDPRMCQNTPPLDLENGINITILILVTYSKYSVICFHCFWILCCKLIRGMFPKFLELFQF